MAQARLRRIQGYATGIARRHYLMVRALGVQVTVMITLDYQGDADPDADWLDLLIAWLYELL